jgi:hypothetical protein
MKTSKFTDEPIANRPTSAEATVHQTRENPSK